MISDLDLLALNIEQEAGGEPDDGKAAVARVVKNRMALFYKPVFPRNCRGSFWAPTEDILSAPVGVVANAVLFCQRITRRSVFSHWDISSVLLLFGKRGPKAIFRIIPLVIVSALYRKIVGVSVRNRPVSKIGKILPRIANLNSTARVILISPMFIGASVDHHIPYSVQPSSFTAVRRKAFSGVISAKASAGSCISVSKGCGSDDSNFSALTNACPQCNGALARSVAKISSLYQQASKFLSFQFGWVRHISGIPSSETIHHNCSAMGLQ